MNIFGMNPMEIMLIMVLALIVFGPAKLPQIMGQVGRAIAEFRRTTSALSDEFNRTIQAELQETRALVDDTKSAVTGVHTTINSAIAGTPAPVRTAVPEALPAANGTNGTNLSSGTNGSTPAAPTPPLADTSQWSWETAAPPPAQPAVVVETPSQPTVTTPSPTRKQASRNDLLPPY